MAEAAVQENVEESKETNENMECAVCLQPCILPAQLPCGHIFCFLCVKGFANQSKKCAMCRQEIPRDFVDQPNLIQRPPSVDNADGFDGGYQWFYEGRNGWWQYDERTSQELETSYKRGEKTCELLIAGFLYVIDLENMLQLRRNDPSRRRKIKRDFSSIEKKGVAGLRTNDDVESIQYLEGDQDSIRPINPTEGRIDATATPTNTPQSTSTSGRQSPEQNRHDDIQAVVDSIYSLRLESTENSDDSTNERPQKHIVLNNIRNGHREREM